MNGFKMVSMCAYGVIPALDFEMNESEFKEYVDSLNNFTNEEIQGLKEYLEKNYEAEKVFINEY